MRIAASHGPRHGIGALRQRRDRRDDEKITDRLIHVCGSTRSGNYILVSGNYQSGTSVVDFSDPANAFEIAYSDPPPIDPIDLGGAWSSYWYNGLIYETSITEGLNIFRFTGPETSSAIRMPHMNPQTMEFTIG